jgi:polar amino acid transport system ATP-binding protein
MSADQSIVRFRNVRKTFPIKSGEPLVVLNGFDLDVRPNEQLAIIGTSGSGKSTVLRMLMTLERPDAGEILVEGEPLWTMERNGRRVPADTRHLRRLRGKIGIVFQHFNLFPHMTVLRNVTEAPIHVLGLPKAEAETRATDLLAQVGLSDKLGAYPEQLSGGQKQRVAIARALALRPRVMCFDEVTSALDPELVGEVLQVMRTLAREQDQTMLVVTHEMGFARDVADRVCFIDGGRVVEQGPPSQVLGDPQQPRTREFLKAVLNP